MIVSADGNDLNYIVKIIHNGHIQSSPAKVEYQVASFLFLA